MYDGKTYKNIRNLGKHQNKITDMCFNSSGNWLLTAAMDKTLKVFKLITFNLDLGYFTWSFN